MSVLKSDGLGTLGLKLTNQDGESRENKFCGLESL